MSGWGSAGAALADGQGDGDGSSRVTLGPAAAGSSEKEVTKKKEFASVRTLGLRWGVASDSTSTRSPSSSLLYNLYFRLKQFTLPLYVERVSSLYL